MHCEQVTLSVYQKIVSYFLLLGNFRVFLFSLNPKRMQSLERTHQHEQAESSSHQKSWRLRAVIGRFEYSTGRYVQPNRAGCTNGASIAIPPKKKLRMEKQKATFQQRIDSYMSSIYLGRMRASGQCE